MPRGDIAFNDWKLDEAQIRQRETYYRQSGRRWWLVLAIDEKTGEGVGCSDIEFDPRDPHAIEQQGTAVVDRKSTRLNSSHRCISYAVFCLKKKKRKTEYSKHID